MKAKFKYLETEVTMQINKGEKALDICNKYAFKANMDINDYDYKYEEITINLEEPLIEQLELPEDQDEIVIIVTKKKRIVELNIEGTNEKVEVKEGHTIGDAINALLRRLKLPLKRFNFLYNGKYMDENEVPVPLYIGKITTDPNRLVNFRSEPKVDGDNNVIVKLPIYTE